MRFALLCILLLFAAWLGYTEWQPQQHQHQATVVPNQHHQQIQDRIAVSDTSLVYLLRPDHWTTFTIPAGTPSLRLLTNATLPAHVKVSTDSRWNYQLEYEFLDQDDQLLLKRDYAYDAGLKQFRDVKSGAYFSPSFYLEAGIKPTDGRIIVLNMTGLATVARLRVRIKHADPVIMDVALRVYRDETVPEFRLAHRWLRLSDKQKEKLARGNVYSQELLAEEEIRNLLRIKSQPIGPSGIAGNHYLSRTLYTTRDHAGEVVTQPLLPAGFYVDAYTHGTIPLPEGGGKVRLLFTPMAGAPESGSKIAIHWYGRLQKERSTVALRWSGKTSQYSQHWDGGLLELVASGQLAVRVFLTLPDQAEREITPQGKLLRTFIAHVDDPVEFAVDHVGDAPTPFRLDIRQQCSPATTEGMIHLRYQLIDPYGRVKRDGIIEASPPRSRYARLPLDRVGMRLTEPASHYFSLPADVRSIRFYADTSLLLNAYTRPEQLVRHSRVPEDYFDVYDVTERQPSWFSLKPKHFRYLLINHRSLLLSIQRRPPQTNEAILAGHYQWEDLHPKQAYLRMLFTPLQPGEGERDEALPSIYRPIKVGAEVGLTLQAANRRQISPKLAYFRHRSAPFQVRFYLDGQLYYRGRLAGTDGEVSLPDMAVGHHRVRIESDKGIAFYLNYNKPISGSLLKRASNRFDGRPLQMMYTRGNHAKETLAMRLYTPQGESSRSIIRVRMDMPADRVVGPVRSWSFINRRFDIRSETLEGHSARVAAYRRDTTNLGQAFSIPIAENIPPGSYTLHISLEQGSGGYLLLSRIVPGLADKRDVSVEQELRYVHVPE